MLVFVYVFCMKFHMIAIVEGKDICVKYKIVSLMRMCSYMHDINIYINIYI